MAESLVALYIYISNIYSNVCHKEKKSINKIEEKRSYIIEENNRHYQWCLYFCNQIMQSKQLHKPNKLIQINQFTMAYKKYRLTAKENMVKKKQPNIQEVKELMKKIENKMKEVKQKDKSTKILGNKDKYA